MALTGVQEKAIKYYVENGKWPSGTSAYQKKKLLPYVEQYKSGIPMDKMSPQDKEEQAWKAGDEYTENGLNRKDANKKLDELYDSMEHTSKEEDAKTVYMMDSDSMNAYLRGQDSYFEDKSAIRQIKSSMSQYNLEDSLYRGVDGSVLGIKPEDSIEDIKKKLVGKSYSDKGFVSTSLSKDVAIEFSSRGAYDEYESKVKTVMVIDAKGSKATYIKSGLSEVLLDANTRVYYTDVKKDGDTVYVYATTSKERTKSLRSMDGHSAADSVISDMEERIKKVYEQAQKDIEAKTKDFWERHKAKDAMYRQQVKDGKITPEDYQAWLRGQVFQGKQWDAKMEQVQSVLADTNKQALSIINGGRVDVFATNANWQAFQIEKSAGVNFGFGIYDADTVTRLLRDDPDLLPAKKLSVTKDKVWNKGNINRQISQGIIQGEKLEDIAKRLRNVTDMNRSQSLTNARTMMTGAQNAGRQETYQRAKKMGIKVRKTWLATLDGHTRTNHRKLDGQTVDVDKPFKIGGYSIMYPGDRHAKPEMVYNCRCTTISEVVDYPSENAQRYDNVIGKPIKDLTYKEWSSSKESVKYKINTNKYNKVSILSGDWELWAVDPEPFQDALLHGDRSLNAGWGKVTEEEQERILDVSQQIQIEASTHKYKDVVTTYRGESYATKEEAEALYKSGSTVTNRKLTSNTTKKSIAEEYADMGDEVKVIQVITNRGGVRGIMTDPMGIGGSDEIISPVGSSYKVTRTSWNENSSTLTVYLFAEDNKKLSRSSAEELLQSVKEGKYGEE